MSPVMPLAYPQTQLQPPPYHVTVNQPDGATGYVFITTGQSSAALKHPTSTDSKPTGGGLEILDKSGNVVFFDQLPPGLEAGNFRVQQLHGNDVLTWWQGVGVGHGEGTDYIADSHYQIKSITPAGLTSDTHEFRLTPDGKALITSYKRVTQDLTAVGGAKNATMFDCIASVVDVDSGKTLFQWSALDHIPLTDTTIPLSMAGAPPTLDRTPDPFHMNSIYPGTHGDLLISLRNTSTIYDVDMASGKINWQLRGQPGHTAGSTLSAGPGIEFAYQHDAQFVDDSTVRLMNNNGAPRVGQSSAVWIHVDPAAKTANLVHEQPAPEGVVNDFMGNVSQVGDDGAFIGWGSSGAITEYSKDGRLLYRADTENPSYRAYLQHWTATPSWPAELVAGPPQQVAAVWNGATEVARWRLLRGDDANDLKPVTTVDWQGFNTTIALPAGTPATGYFQAVALDKDGKQIGATKITQLGS